MKKDNKKNLKKKLRLSKGMLLLQELPEIIAEEIAGTFQSQVRAEGLNSSLIQINNIQREIKQSLAELVGVFN